MLRLRVPFLCARATRRWKLQCRRIRKARSRQNLFQQLERRDIPGSMLPFALTALLGDQPSAEDQALSELLSLADQREQTLASSLGDSSQKQQPTTPSAPSYSSTQQPQYDDAQNSDIDRSLTAFDATRHLLDSSTQSNFSASRFPSIFESITSQLAGANLDNTLNDDATESTSHSTIGLLEVPSSGGDAGGGGGGGGGAKTPIGEAVDQPGAAGGAMPQVDASGGGGGGGGGNNADSVQSEPADDSASTVTAAEGSGADNQKTSNNTTAEPAKPIDGKASGGQASNPDKDQPIVDLPKAVSEAALIKAQPQSKQFQIKLADTVEQRGEGRFFVVGALDLKQLEQIELNSKKQSTLDIFAVKGGRLRRLGEATIDREQVSFRLTGSTKLDDNEQIFAHLHAGDGMVGVVSERFNLNRTVRDQDADGLSSEIEAIAKGGDGNRDGIADADQFDVASFPDAVSGRAVSIDASGKRLTRVRPISPRSGYEKNLLPYGLFEFNVENVKPGAIEQIDVYLPDDVATDRWYKQNPSTGRLTEFYFDGHTGAIRTDFGYSLFLQDGGRGDDDGIVNGSIFDPGGAGIAGSVVIGNPGEYTAWTHTVEGGSGGGKGTVSYQDGVRIDEGNSFLVSVRQEIELPDDPSWLTFGFEVSFDDVESGRINDAFEVALLDAEGNSLVPTIDAHRDSYFNITERAESTLIGGTLRPEVAISIPDGPDGLTNTYLTRTDDRSDPGFVAGYLDLDVSQLASGQVVTLMLRMINNDGDTGSWFRLRSDLPLPVASDDVFVTAEDAELNNSSAGYISLVANDLDGDPDAVRPITVLTNTVTQPSHGTVSVQADGSFVYTPDAGYFNVGDNGTPSDPSDDVYDSFTYFNTNGLFSSATAATVRVHVQRKNQAPLAVNDTLPAIAQGSSATTDPRSNDSDPDGDPLTIGEVNGQSITVNAPVTFAGHTVTLLASGGLTITPAASFHGVLTVPYTISDGKATATAFIDLPVTQADEPPAGTDRTFLLAEDSSHTFSASQFGFSDPAQTVPDSFVAVKIATLPDSDDGSLTLDGNAVAANQVIEVGVLDQLVFTPKLNVFGENLGAFTFQVQDSGQSNNLDLSPNTIQFTVAGVNDPPQVTNDLFIIDEDTTLSVSIQNSVLANDREVDGELLRAELATSPSASQFSFQTDGTFTFTPVANSTDTITFTYRAVDDQGSFAVATVSIQINPINDAPIARKDEPQALEAGGVLNAAVGTNPTGNVLANDSDIETPGGIVVSGVAVGNSAPAAANVGTALTGVYGSLTLAADGTYSYTVNNSHSAVEALRTSLDKLTDIFSYRIEDPAGLSSTAAITVSIQGANDAPVANSDIAVAIEAGGLNNGTSGTNPNGNVLTNDTDVDSNDSKVVVGVAAGTVGAATTNVGVDVLGNYGKIQVAAGGGYTYIVDNSLSAVQALRLSTDTLTDVFTYTMRDTAGLSSTSNVTVTIQGSNDAPLAVNDAYSATEDTTLTVVVAEGVLINDRDPDGPTLTVSLGDEPTHGTLALNINGSFTYEPDANFAGTDSFTYTVSDGSLTSNVATVVIKITGVNDPPVAVNNSYTIDEDTTLNVSAAGILGNDSDPDNDSLTAIGVGEPSITINANGSLSFTPEANATGVKLFHYQAFDGQAYSNLATITITITPVNDAPVATVDIATAIEAGGVNNGTVGVNPTGNVLANDTDVDNGDTKSVVGVIAGIAASATGNVGANVSGSYGTLNVAVAGAYSYTVDNSLAAVQALRLSNQTLTDVFTYTIQDAGGLVSTALVSVTIQGANDAPIATPDAGTAIEAGGVNNGAAGTAASGNVLANDSDVDAGDTKTVTGVAVGTVTAASQGVGSVLSGAYGTISISSSGAFTYNVNNNNIAVQALRTSVQTLVDIFTYTMRDAAGLSSTTQVTITITGSNDAPIAVSDTAIAVESGGVNNGTPGSNATGNVLANDNDVDAGDTTTVTGIIAGNANSAIGNVGSSVLGSYGSVQVDSGGVFTYVVDNSKPAVQALRTAADTLSDVFTYTMTDTAGLSSTTRLTITIQGANDAPIANSDNYSTNEQTTLTIAAAGILANDSDIDGGPLSALLESNPTKGTLVLSSNGGFTYTPFATSSGTDSFTYRAHDGLASSNLATVTITINPVNSPPSGQDKVVTINEDSSYTFTQSDFGFSDSLDTPSDSFLQVIISTLPSAADGTLKLGTTPVTVNQAIPVASIASLRFDPVANLAGTNKGSFTFKVRDNGGTANGGIDTDPTDNTFAFNLTPINDAPVAFNDSYATNEDMTLTVSSPGVLINDSDIDTPQSQLQVSLNSLPSKGTVTFGANGAFSYVPLPNQNGSDSFTYRLFDGTDYSNVATVAITIQAVNDAPVANDDNYVTQAGATLTVASVDGLLSNDTDTEGQSLSFVQVSGLSPSNAGTFNYQPSGSFVFTPATSFSGLVTLTYTITDGALTSAPATVTITVNSASVYAKFYVTNQSQSTKDIFSYNEAGTYVARWGHQSNDRARGLTANAAGDTLWMVTAGHDVLIYSASGTQLGKWTSPSLNNPEGIATNGTDLWIVDQAGNKNNLLYFANAASRRDGSAVATKSFPLHSSNKNPRGVEFDGTRVYVVDDKAQDIRVFVYNTSGQHLGNWKADLGSGNHRAEDIALDPTGGSELWILDDHMNRVSFYPQGTTYLNGTYVPASSFLLHSDNHAAYGIADPPNSDPGDTTATAYVATLTSGLTTTLNETIGNGTHGNKDVDFYEFTLQTGQTISIEADLDVNSNSQLDSYIRLFDNSNNQVASNDDDGSYGGDASLTYTAASGGTFRLGVSGAPNSNYIPTTANSGVSGSTGAYVLKLSPNAPDVPGDTIATASTLTLGQATSSTQIGNGFFASKDVDFYSLNLAADDEIVVSLAGLGGASGFIRLFNSSGSQLETSSTQSGTSPTLNFANGSSSQTVYIGVSTFANQTYQPSTPGSGTAGGATYSYTLLADLDLPPGEDAVGDTFATATAVTLTGGQTTTRNSTIGDNSTGGTDVDMFEFSLVANQTIVLDIDTEYPSSFDSYLRLFDSTGTQVTFNDNDNNSSDAYLSYTATTAGLYRVGVSGAPNSSYNPTTAHSGTSGSTGDYTLKLIPNAADAPGDTIATATSLAIGNSATAAIGDGFFGSKDVDFYELFLGSEENLAVTLSGINGGSGYLRLFNASGTQLANSSTTYGSSPSLNYLNGTTSQTVYVGVSTLQNQSYNPNTAGSGTAGGSSLTYTLNTGLLGEEPGDTIALAKPTSLTPTITTRFNEFLGDGLYLNKDVDFYSVSLAAGQSLTATVEPEEFYGYPNQSINFFSAAGEVLATTNYQSQPSGGRH